jgi:hypothetical protein
VQCLTHRIPMTTPARRKRFARPEKCALHFKLRSARRVSPSFCEGASTPGHPCRQRRACKESHRAPDRLAPVSGEISMPRVCTRFAKTCARRNRSWLGVSSFSQRPCGNCVHSGKPLERLAFAGRVARFVHRKGAWGTVCTRARLPGLGSRPSFTLIVAHE